MSQSLADHVWPTQGLQHEIQAICYPTERRSAFLLPILWQNWGVELRSVLIKHPNCQRFANPPGSFYGVAFDSIGIQSAAPLNHMAQSDPDGTGRIEFAAILSNNIPWMSLPRGLREEGRRDGEKRKSDKKNLTPKRLTFKMYLPLFPDTHMHTSALSRYDVLMWTPMNSVCPCSCHMCDGSTACRHDTPDHRSTIAH